jgi:cysteinyl-tRNA synthetase
MRFGFMAAAAFTLVVALTVVNCGGDGGGGATVAATTDDNDTSASGNTQYKQDMRSFVQNISAYGRSVKADFIVIPQNGHELVTEDGSPTGAAATAYLGAINGVGREDLFFGNPDDDVATSAAAVDKIVQYMDIAKANNVQPLVTDYCWTRAHVDDSYARNLAKGYTSFAADNRELDRIPAYPAPTAPTGVNTNNITTLAEAKNFLYLLNSSVLYATKAEFLNALKATHYDAFIIDLFFDDNDLGQVAFTAAEVDTLRTKPDGGSRLVLAYMSIGEAEDYRFYWSSSWGTSPPSWLEGENPEWLGNYKVKYWEPAWQAVIYGNDASYLKKILDAGFDGVYLDIIDAFEYFESK